MTINQIAAVPSYLNFYNGTSRDKRNCHIDSSFLS